MSDNPEKDGVDSNLFDSLGLSVEYGNVEIGQTYPIYGMITKFINDIPGQVVILVNENIELSLSVDDQEKVAILKARALEPGIFVSTIEQVGDVIKGYCSTVVFGKKQDTLMQ